DGEKKILLAMLDKQQLGANERVQLLLRTTLQSPAFLYVLDKPDQDGSGKLSQETIIARLTFFLWRSTYDLKTLEDSRSVDFTQPEQVRKLISGMLADERGRRGLKELATEWFGLGLIDSTIKDAALYGPINPSQKAWMKAEVYHFVTQVGRTA